MPRTTGANAKTSPQELPEVPDVEEPEDTEDSLLESSPQLESQPEIVADTLDKGQNGDHFQSVDDILNSLKALLSAVEKLQKIRQEVGDIKPLLTRMLDGDLVSGEELEQLKTGVSGLLRLVRAYGDHQAALTKAQTARSLLDEVLKVHPSPVNEQ
jgi:DNA-binding transcriptional regulator GbsR (MarR family)